MYLDYKRGNSKKVKVYNFLNGYLNYIKLIRGRDDLVYLRYFEQFNLLIKRDLKSIPSKKEYNEKKLTEIANELDKYLEELPEVKNDYYLFFDTETTGLPINWKAAIYDLDNWPRLVQIAWILTDSSGVVYEEECHIIKPNGFQIPDNVSKIHGITNQHALDNGISIQNVLSKFEKSVNKSRLIIAHNIDFDYKVLASELVRNGNRDCLNEKSKFCTMKSSTNFCKLNGNYGYKWPKLNEL